MSDGQKISLHRV